MKSELNWDDDFWRERDRDRDRDRDRERQRETERDRERVKFHNIIIVLNLHCPQRLSKS